MFPCDGHVFIKAFFSSAAPDGTTPSATGVLAVCYLTGNTPYAFLTISHINV